MSLVHHVRRRVTLICPLLVIAVITCCYFPHCDCRVSCEEKHWDAVNILFYIKPSPTCYTICCWFLPELIISVVTFAKRWISCVCVCVCVCVCIFLGPHPRHMEVPRLGVQLELQMLTYTTAHGNARSLTHLARPGIKLGSSQILVRYLPQWAITELQCIHF